MRTSWMALAIVCLDSIKKGGNRMRGYAIPFGLLHSNLSFRWEKNQSCKGSIHHQGSDPVLGHSL